MTDENKRYYDMVQQLIDYAGMNDVFSLTSKEFRKFDDTVMEILYQAFDS